MTLAPQTSESGAVRRWRGVPSWALPIVALPLALSLPFFAGATLLFRDILHFVAPQQAFAAQALAHGRLPLWNPLLFGGVPFLAEPGSGVFYPPNLVFLALVPHRAATAPGKSAAPAK